jgi:transposase, IS5 family
MVGLHVLKHMFTLSDEEVCARWEYDPYFRYFCGEAYFQHRFPIERFLPDALAQTLGRGML